MAPEIAMKNCKYPKCMECEYSDCIMEEDDIHAMLKRRRWNANPEAYQQKQRDYRNRIYKFLPRCDECDNCISQCRNLRMMINDLTRGCMLTEDEYRQFCIVINKVLERMEAEEKYERS